MKVEWKTIEDFPRYSVSNTGLVRRDSTGKVLKARITPAGYCEFGLSSEKHRNKKEKAHRLVAKAFIENPEIKPEVNHIDGIKTNNTLSNLEWVTSSENQKHAFRLGLQKPIANRENHHNSKLSDGDVCWIKEMLKNGVHQRKIAKIFGVIQQNISCIATGKTWNKPSNIKQQRSI